MKVSREPLHCAGASKGALVAPPHVTYAQCNSIGVAVMLRHRWYSHHATDGATNTAGTAITLHRAASPRSALPRVPCFVRGRGDEFWHPWPLAPGVTPSMP
jgi:hypothetical protein